MRTLFLPVGLILAILTGILLQGSNIPISRWSVMGVRLQHLIVVGIFLISGYRLERGGSPLGSKLVLILLAAGAVNLLLGPAAALGCARVFGVKAAIYVGLLTMACVPTTLSSGVVIARNAGGNVLLALVLTVFLTFTGVTVSPFTLGFCLDVGARIELPALPVLLKMIRLVLLPVLAGMGARKLLQDRDHAVLDYLPSAGVILIVWMTVCENAGSLAQFSSLALFSLVAASVSVHLVLLVAGWVCARALSLSPGDSKALIIVSAQKTLPIAITVLMVLPSPPFSSASFGTATIACVIFHFTQILADSLLASRMGRR
jgi:predicted Na+-dependent transporter